MCNLDKPSSPKKVIDKCIYKSWFVVGMKTLVSKAKDVRRIGLFLGALLALALPVYGNKGLEPIYLGETYGTTNAIACGDLNRDGRVDKAEANTEGNIDGYFHNGSNYGNPFRIASRLGTITDMIALDVDFDDDIDLLTSTLEGQVYFSENAGNGRFVKAESLFSYDKEPGRITGISAYENPNGTISLWMVTPSSRYGMLIKKGTL